MEITVTGRKIEMTDALRNRVEEKIKGIQKFLDGVKEVHIVLSVEKYRHFAEVILNANGYVIHCKEETEDMYSSIDRVIEKLLKQLKKHKDKITNLKNKKRLGEENVISFRKDILSYEKKTMESVSPEIIKSKKLDAKPMFIEEASMQIRSTKSNFLVFRNASNGRVNVLYIRNDGNLGLIDST